MKEIFPTYRFYAAMFLVVFFMASSFLWAWLFYIVLLLLSLLLIVFAYEFLQLKSIRNQFDILRDVKEQLSLGDEQTIDYQIINRSNKDVAIELTDELPFQFQYRQSIDQFLLQQHEEKLIAFGIRPTKRGVYLFGDIHLYIHLPKIGLLQYRITKKSAMETKVYPSVIQMKKYALQVFSMTASMFGIRNIRTIGENDEFERIRPFQSGDNIKSINWKATSRQGELLVNQYQDSRSQNVYCIIDKGRSMEMPFNDMSLLDYSINAALVISNIVLNKYDKAGFIGFSKDIDVLLPAESNHQQLARIIGQLYHQDTVFDEPNFEKLYYSIRQRISRRSILFLFTNFESIHDLNRNLKYLKAISKRHLLIVISFENSELTKLGAKEATNLSEIYDNTISNSFIYEKKKIIKELNLHGIQTIFTEPEDLSINVINKYLELKAKRMK